MLSLVYIVGSFISFIFGIFVCYKEMGKITVQDVIAIAIMSVASWLMVVFIAFSAQDIVLYEKKK